MHRLPAKEDAGRRIEQLRPHEPARALPGHLGHRDRQARHRCRFGPAGRQRDPAPQPPVRQPPATPSASVGARTPLLAAHAQQGRVGRPAIDDVDVTNAAMQVIPGSHHHAQPAFRDSIATENNVLMQTVDNAGDDGHAPVAPEFRAGEISLHSDRILHGSEPNRSKRRRCGPAMRHLPADVRAYDGWVPTPCRTAAPTPVATGPSTIALTAKRPPPRRQPARKVSHRRCSPCPRHDCQSHRCCHQ